MLFNSDAKQDQFVANMLHFKRNGVYVDIGSCGSTGSNNSFYFDHCLDWKGLCVEIEPSYAPTYVNRKACAFINQDATLIDYKKLFADYELPTVIDYLSLDVDTLSFKVLELVLASEHIFKVITIEHDGYLYGNEYREKQRGLLKEEGYLCVCSNVLVEQPGFEGKVCPFEDWWVNPLFFDSALIEQIECESTFPSEIIKKFP